MLALALYCSFQNKLVLATNSYYSNIAAMFNFDKGLNIAQSIHLTPITILKIFFKINNFVVKKFFFTKLKLRLRYCVIKIIFGL